MQIEQRGTPPYTVFSSRTTEIRAHPATRDTFLGAMEVFFSLADAGCYKKSALVITPPMVIDSKGKVVLSAGDGNDLELLRKIDKKGLVNLRVIGK